MKLKHRTTYRRGDGAHAHIVGPTGEPGMWWSIEGDHYTSDGHMAGYSETGRFIYPESWRSLVEPVDTKDEARKWIGVKHYPDPQGTFDNAEVGAPWSLDEQRANDNFVLSDADGNVACLIPTGELDGPESEARQRAFVDAVLGVINRRK